MSEVLARLAADPTFGQHGEEIRGTQTPGLDSTQAYHFVTFHDRTGYARSRHNPPGAIHVISTGYCRGRWCCLEALILQPTFP